MAIEERTSLNYVNSGAVYILGDFDNTISKNVIPNLYDLINTVSPQKNPTIEFFINSSGGYATELYALYTMIGYAKAQGIIIVTTNMGRAYSAGSLLAVVGDYRRMMKYATNLMHFGTSSAIVETPKQQDRENKRIQRHFDNLVDIYKTHTKLDMKKIREYMSDDCFYLNAKECLKYGLCDEIIEKI